MKTENGVTTKYVYGLGLIYEETTNDIKVYHYDYRGSTVALTDSTGEVTDTFEYDTYGSMTARTGTTVTPFLYNGRDGVMSDENGLVYMRARYYSPVLKRFINADVVAGSIANAITLNRYAYANGNPVSNIDPFGLSAERGGGSGIEYAKSADEYISMIVASTSHYALKYGNIHFDRRIINGTEKIIINGKSWATNSVGIPQRIINSDNLSKYNNIDEFMGYSDTYSRWRSFKVNKNLDEAIDIVKDGVLKGAKNILNEINILDAVFVVAETTYAVSQYDDMEDKVLIGTYTASMGVLETVASATATAIGTAIGGPLVGFLAGFVTGKIVEAVDEWVFEEYIAEGLEAN